ncbi:MAG: PEP-CTERM sorting domain-containing protein [bacterium]
MKKICLVLALAVLMIGASQDISHAGLYTFQPSSSDLWDLVHQEFYTWGIDWDLPSGETIISATLTYQQMWDHRYEADSLYTHLLDSAYVASGAGTYTGTVTVGTDNEGGGDNFSTQGLLLGVWHDPYGDSNHKVNLTYSIPEANFAWLSDGNFGFGIDPDCHYYNDGIYFTIETSTIPEPATMSLLGLGLLGLAGLKRKKS